MLSLEQQSYANICLYRLNTMGVPWKTWRSNSHFNLCAITHGIHFYLADYEYTTLNDEGYLVDKEGAYLRIPHMYYPMSMYTEGFDSDEITNMHRIGFSINMTEYFNESLRDALKSRITDRGRVI